MCGSGKEENRMLQLLSGSQRTVDALGFLLAFALTALMDSVFREKLPHDHGRAFAVNGELSKGKARGSGLIFVLCIALVTLAVVPLRTEYIIYTVLLIASMLSGYFDDASEVAWNEYKKGLIDLVIAIVAGVTYLNFNSTTVNFLQWSFAIPYPLYLVLIVVLIWASINVVNCTDGVDGLCASITLPVMIFFTAAAAAMGKYDLALLPAALSGGLVAYLFYNWHPAKVFMGDTGSLFLGGVVCAMAFALEMPLILILIGFVYVCEAMSDILQVSYFKATHGKRLFKMAPIHHHFEMCGWKEEKIVLVFAGVTAAMCVLAWFGIAGLVG